MKTFLAKITLIILSVTIISCNGNDDQVEINDFKVFYQITSINSSVPIDLNNDGLKSTDYLQEIKSNYIDYEGDVINFMYDNEHRYYLAEARPTKVQNNDAQFLDIQFPIQRIDSIFQGNDNYAITTMEYRNIRTGFIYKLFNNDIEIESDPFNQFEYYNISNFQIRRINKTEFEVFFDFKVYDFTENSWIETNLNGTYKKRLDYQ